MLAGTRTPRLGSASTMLCRGGGRGGGCPSSTLGLQACLECRWQLRAEGVLRARATRWTQVAAGVGMPVPAPGTDPGVHRGQFDGTAVCEIGHRELTDRAQGRFRTQSNAVLVGSAQVGVVAEPGPLAVVSQAQCLVGAGADEAVSCTAVVEASNAGAAHATRLNANAIIKIAYTIRFIFCTPYYHPINLAGGYPVFSILPRLYHANRRLFHHSGLA